MSLFRFVIDDDDLPDLRDYVVEVQTENYPGFTVDNELLKDWCLGIADDFVRGLISRNELVADAIKIRIFDVRLNLLVDTIAIEPQ